MTFPLIFNIGENMVGIIKLFIWKFTNRLKHLLRLKEIWQHSTAQKMSCKKCGCHIYYDFNTSDSNWNKLPNKWINSALCINCFKELVNPEVEFFELESELNRRQEAEETKNLQSANGQY